MTKTTWKRLVVCLLALAFLHTTSPSGNTAGDRQSPINLTGATRLPREARAPTVDYVNTPLEWGHGHFNCEAKNNTITAEGKKYTLEQFHFHYLSEHKVNDNGFAMEAHLVHKAGNKLLVLAVFLKEVKTDNPTIQRILKATANGGSINPKELLPRGTINLYRYHGSLTTGSFSENVNWYVCGTPIEVSTKQIAAFRKGIAGSNRKIQDSNNRKIFFSSVKLRD